MAVASQTDARKSTLEEKEAFELLRGADEIYAARGKRVVHVDLKKEKPGREMLAALLLGPTGNLRAPTLRQGRTLIVGFDEATYRELFGRPT